MRFRVVCGLEVTMPIFGPPRRFRSVDFPALGRPTMATKPARRPSFCGSIFSFSGITIRRDPLIRRGDAERLHFAVQAAALESARPPALRQLPGVFLPVPQNKSWLVGAARHARRA